MATTSVKSERSKWQRRLGALVHRGNGERSQNKNAHADRHLRYHWRPSLRFYNLASWKPNRQFPSLKVFIESAHLEIKDAANDDNQTIETNPFPYLQLPLELRGAVESWLLPADLVCLRQTCQTLHKEVYGYKNVQDISTVDRYSLRRRLDRDSFPMLCALEKARRLPKNLSVCEPCLTIHDRKYFAADLRSIQSVQPHCRASESTVWICGPYHTPALTLRAILDEISNTCENHSRTYKAILCHEYINWHGTTFYQTIDDPPTEDDQYEVHKFLVDERGLVLELHRHEPMHVAGAAWSDPFSFPRQIYVYTCPHIRDDTARAELRLPYTGLAHPAVTNKYTYHCWYSACRTSFGVFECTDSCEIGVTHLCYRIQRVFGWLESWPEYKYSLE